VNQPHPSQEAGSGGRRGSDTDNIVAQLAGPLDWRQVSAAESRAHWQALREWVQWLVQRYSLDARVVPPCWYLHPQLVDLLTALRDQHRGAFHHLAPLGSAASWHQNRWQFETRLRDCVSQTGCSRDTHRDDPAIDWPQDTQRWNQHLDRDAAERAEREERAERDRLHPPSLLP
jgi:hypothetical protein